MKDEALNKWGAHLIYFQIVVRYARFLFFLLLVIEIPSLKNNTNCVLTCNTHTKQFLKFSLRHRRFFEIRTSLKPHERILITLSMHLTGSAQQITEGWAHFKWHKSVAKGEGV